MFPELVTRPDLQVFLPPVGGTTVYLFGDVARLADPDTSITCRVHDECNGSDVFGSDICTCRPYLLHGIEECVRAAQAGGLGLIVYNRKEGRALGEVTKFLVYNARKRQEGGDAAAAYFERTECVAGVQDARFQQLMPDAINWLGLERIDRLVSMSDMKYDALCAQGIRIVERVPLPDDLVPADAHVEMAAKKAAGYYAPQQQTPRTSRRPSAAAWTRADGADRSPDTCEDGSGCRTVPIERQRGPPAGASLLAIGLEDGLAHFRVDLARLDEAADLVVETTREAYPDLEVPFHSRWRHFVVGGDDRWAAIEGATPWHDAAERARAAFDLAITSVLLDAGAGPQWFYRDAATGMEVGRSEGLALASLAMFAGGAFSARPDSPLRADAKC